MLHRTGFLIVTLCAAAACGPDKPATDVDATATATASAETAPETDPSASVSTSAPANPRAEQAKKLLTSLESHELFRATRARLAGSGLTEGPFGLTKEQMVGFKAVASQQSVEPIQCGRIVVKIFEDGSKDAFQKRCGDIAALKKKVDAAKPGQGAKEVATACKIDAPAADLPKLNPWGLLASALLSDQMKADPASSPDEQAIAHHMVWLCTPEE